VTYVGNGAFFNMPNITSVTFPASVTGLGFRIFEGSSALSTAYFLGDAPTAVETNNFNDCADNFTICYPDGAAGWTSPVWNGWPADHTVLNDGILTHNSACAKAGTRAVLAIYNENRQFLGYTTKIWGTSSILELALPSDDKTTSLCLFYLDAAAPLRPHNDLTGLLTQATE